MPARSRAFHAGFTQISAEPPTLTSVAVRQHTHETVWLSLNQMANLLDGDKSVVSPYLRNIFRSGELERGSVVAEPATTAADGKRCAVEFVNLDAILSVGYLVNSGSTRCAPMGTLA